MQFELSTLFSVQVSISHTKLSHLIQEENVPFVEGQIREYGVVCIKTVKIWIIQGQLQS